MPSTGKCKDGGTGGVSYPQRGAPWLPFPLPRQPTSCEMPPLAPGAAGAAWFASTGEAVGGEKLAGIPEAVAKRLLVGESELTTHFG